MSPPSSMIIIKTYACQGKADSHFIPPYALPDHVEDNKRYQNAWTLMAQNNKRWQKFYIKHSREVAAIRVPRKESIDLSSEPLSDEVCRARDRYRKGVKCCKKPEADQQSVDIVPDIKIDRVDPKLQRMKPSEWTFEAATKRKPTCEELAERQGNLLSPCDTRTAECAAAEADPTFVPALPTRSRSMPIKSTKAKEENKHRFSKIFRRTSS